MGFLIDTAQNAMDLYFQQYRSDEEFFQEYHFKYLCGIAYAKLLQEEYEKSYNKNLAEHGLGEAQLNPDWFISIETDVKASDIGDREIVLKQKPFTFRYDKQSSGIQGLFPLNGKCGDFIRITIDEIWKLKRPPATNITWWYPVANKILLSKTKCGLNKVRIVYIPAIGENDDEIVPQQLEEDIIKKVLELMFAARQGVVIDKTSNQNTNKVIESEIDTAFQKIKTGR